MKMRVFDWNKDDFSNIEKPEKKAFQEDNELKLNSKTGEYDAIVRLLPNHPDEAKPFAKYYEHIWKEAGKWNFIPCSLTIGKDWCPVCKRNEAIKEKIVDDKPHWYQISFVFNCVVLSHEQDPELKGKVKILKISSRVIEEKIHDLLQKGIFPWDYSKGVDLHLNGRLAEDSNGWKNWDWSGTYFDQEPSRIHSIDGKMLTDPQLEILDKKIYPLKPYLDPKKFEEAFLIKKLERNTGKSWKRFKLDEQEAVDLKELEISSIGSKQKENKENENNSFGPKTLDQGLAAKEAKPFGELTIDINKDKKQETLKAIESEEKKEDTPPIAIDGDFMAKLKARLAANG